MIDVVETAEFEEEESTYAFSAIILILNPHKLHKETLICYLVKETDITY